MQNIDPREIAHSPTTRLPHGSASSRKIEVIVPTDPPELTPDTARALLWLIQEVAARTTRE